MPTLRDVAKLACCDVSTVSRALNNNPCVHAETKKRIMAAGFFVKFWGAKVSMHSWRGHALKIVRVLFRCVC